MATYSNNIPSSGSAASVGGLFTNIRNNVELRKTYDPPGGAPSGLWICTQWLSSPTPTSDPPYIEAVLTGQDGIAGDTLRLRFRFDPVLNGTLDPGFVFNGTDDPLAGKWDDFDVQDVIARYSDATVEAFFQGLIGAARNAGLCNGTVGGQSIVRTYTDGAEVGNAFCCDTVLTYDPTGTEFTSGVKQLVYRQVYAGTPGDANVSVGNLGLGTAQDTVPVVVVQEGTQSQGWTDLSTSIENHLWIGDHITNVGDLGGGSGENEPAVPDIDVQVFASPGALVPYVNGTTALSALTTLRGIITAALAASGTALAWFYSRATDWLGAANEVETCFPAVVAQLTRIADSLEAIQDCVVGDDARVETACLLDVLADARTNLQAVAETRQEVTLRMKGVEVQAETGALITGP